MLNYFLKRINNKKGFTLVELVVVISILGVLASIAVPKLTKQTEAAEKAVCDANRKSIESVILLHNLDADPGDEIKEGDDFDLSALEEYFSEQPVCPKGGTYSYKDDIIYCDEHHPEPTTP